MDPVDMKAKLPFVSQYFQQGRRWYFIDAHGQVQGPFTADNMCSWYKAGYFWNRELQICHEGWESYVTIESIVASASTLSAVRARCGFLSVVASHPASSSGVAHAAACPTTCAEHRVRSRRWLRQRRPRRWARRRRA
jgi:hypothetical protein